MGLTKSSCANTAAQNKHQAVDHRACAVVKWKCDLLRDSLFESPFSDFATVVMGKVCNIFTLSMALWHIGLLERCINLFCDKKIMVVDLQFLPCTLHLTICW